MATLNPLKDHMTGVEIAAAIVMLGGYVTGKSIALIAQLAWERLTTSSSPEEKADN